MIAKHSELLFIWDAKMTNPNGDMLNDNAPRFDETDRKAIVSDVRVKRTIRDDLQDRKNKTIFVNNPETVQSAETRFNELQKLSNLKDIKEVFLSCIDNRLFGGVAPSKNIQIIGAVQFSWAKSLNQTETILSQGTGAFGKDGKNNKTFRTDNYLPYALFAMYGTINSINAKKSNATEDDINEMIDSMWNGTKLLNTRSKIGQKPRALFRIIYSDTYVIGLLDELISIKNKNSDDIRKFDECEICFDELIEAIKIADEKIEKIEIYYDESIKEKLSVFKDLAKVDMKVM
ncbi:type I-B CRISPR-associated protein Cas7/Csh2 [Campylobacter ureolyticus]|uniref:Type I-B CRISPR-associated protein Cas7/Csh2 n=1 Tax=Campylobacter ureolyticus TaxID=827 RepID=A0A9Q4KSQ1_9BACT|nr:type I-B CRISPR-associated protein Cas7/Csh2 [Campylobacter ureolyticus]MCZ6103755.1 type I-B CRISPR-associated protein Cas7/Csh2 [Campylobacter ureolyticus]MCZ6134795.1 type I-B CRISPR-associated protein Cas7/Csh2 [Campylobacter ureolyticus]MCZ6162079.1 type I-B CRISPR-associated protein Cas7/Csh2 [Campylobacter ureolyticus]MCZ6170846.1 type I-B CRISPR-associated protein Cas7/Csh2 [Campylobacter ureolyticus]MDU4982250.1 type I-B CRISPR-associated protein Cas7/Csh2 [Campylobacter ureolyticu